MTRITQAGITQGTLQRLLNRLEQVEKAQVRLSSGKVIQRPSDDPAGMNRALGLRAQQRAREQEARNAADGMTLLNMADSQLQTVVSRVHRARDLMVRAPQMDAQARLAAHAEIQSIQEELRAIANTRVGGRPLFGGFAGTDPIGGGPGAWTYDGDAGTVMRRVGEQEQVQVNVTAPEVFGDFDTPDHLFAVFDRMLDGLTGASTPQELSGFLADLDAALNRVGDQQAKVGAATNRIESAMRRNTDELLFLRGELAQVEDVDLAQAVMELQTQEVAYQATLAALSRVLQPSLVDFLR